MYIAFILTCCILPISNGFVLKQHSLRQSKAQIPSLNQKFLNRYEVSEKELSRRSNGFNAKNGVTKLFAVADPTFSTPIRIAAGAVALITILLTLADRFLWKSSRSYNKEENSVGKEYDAWAEDGILEAYWGEHIHLGYYQEKELRSSFLLPPKKDFKQAKFDFIDEMVKFGNLNPSAAVGAPAGSVKILDVGCGIGGSSRYLAKKFGKGAEVLGITLSPKQVERATQLAKEQGVDNAKFQVMDALEMQFPDNSFDIVWACESGEHMPDKKKYVEEMTRVLKPGGKIVIATWCQRDEGNKPFNAEEKRMLKFLYEEWTHPYFISISDYAKLMDGTAQLKDIKTDDWTRPTIASWLHQFWVGIANPWPVFSRPRAWVRTFYDGLALVRMHKSFYNGLMEYGMMAAEKKKSDPAPATAA